MRRSAIAFAILALAAVPARGQNDPAGLLASGRDAYESGDFERARRDLWAYLDGTASVTGPSRLPQAEALYYIALMEPDAGVAAQHYETILHEYPAASVADLALFRLAQYDLVTGRTRQAIERLDELRRGYPFSRTQPEIPLWTGRAHLAAGDAPGAIDAFVQGFTRIKSQDLPVELPAAAREALAAEYAWWLASAYREAGDAVTANQYYTLLALDYPRSPQAEEARRALDGEAGPPLAEAAVTRPPVRAAPEPAPAAEETREPPVVVIDEPPRERPDIEGLRADETGPVTALDEPAKFPPPGGGRRVWIQVGAFTSASNAADLSKRLKADGFDTRVQVAIVEGQGFYRVQVGPYLQPGDRARIDASRDRLTALGYLPREVVEEE